MVLKVYLMLKLPIFDGNVDETLFIIGNGFDLYHGLQSSYRDFHDWLIKYRYTDFVDHMELMFPSLKNGELLLWQDFEAALGSCEPTEIHQNFFQGVNDGLFDLEIQKRVSERIRPTLDKIPKLLQEWVEHLPVSEIRIIPELETFGDRSLFLSFNYTLLLEKVYGVSPERILHIHNCIDNDRPLITGHRVYFDANNASCSDFNTMESVKRISSELNKLGKPVEKIIKEHQSFFESLGNITNVVVFGFSISKIDRLYFTEVFHHVHDDAHWFFVCKDEEAKRNYQQLVSGYNGSEKKKENGTRFTRKMMEERCRYIVIDKCHCI